MGRIPVEVNVIPPACRSRAILPTLVGLCFTLFFLMVYVILLSLASLQKLVTYKIKLL